MLYYFRKHRVRVALILFVAGFSLAALLGLISENAVSSGKIRLILLLVQFELVCHGSLLLFAPGAAFSRIYYRIALGGLTLFPVVVAAVEGMLWMAILLAAFSVGIYSLLRRRLELFLTYSEMRLPIIARDFWHMHDMIRRQDEDPQALKGLFAAVPESERLFDRSWESGDVFHISAMDVRDDLPLAGIFFQFAPQEQGIDDALIGRIDAIVDAAVLSTRARLFGLSVCAKAGTAQVMFYVQPGREKSVLRLLERLISRNGFKGGAALLTDIARFAAEKSLTPNDEVMETGILAARSGMFTRLEMNMTAVQTVYLQVAFDSRAKAEAYMDAHRESRFVDMGYWDPERDLFMVIVAVESDLRVRSMAREVVPLREAGATLLDVETELDGLYRSEQELAEEE